MALLPILVPPHSIWNSFQLILALGVVGLIAFARKIDATVEVRETLKIPGDGTSELLNNSAQILILIAAAIAYYWWLGWVTENNVPSGGGLYRTFVSACIGLIIATLHELGHAIAGLALGMKLRSFVVGPFQWQVRDGRWEFEFNPKGILGGGKTGVVPPRPSFPRWAQLCMSAAGVFVNVVTGILALWATFVTYANSPLPARGLLCLFGIWSVLLGPVNLVPFRTGYNYSDGAQIYQLLSKGPWADLHRVFTVAGASLVTAVRPRDYDIEAIRRAGDTIKQGFQGLFLRLLAYNYFLDQGRTQDATESLREAALIYNDSASNVPAELLTAFVFGSAYLCRDAALSRAWWTQMELTKPSRFNVDYWLAQGALHWIEGNLNDANQRWEQANKLANELPKVGAYEFERHCCGLLRQALDEVVTPT